MILLQPSIKCDKCGITFNEFPATPARRAARNAILTRIKADGWTVNARDDIDICPVCNGTEEGPI